MGLVLADQRPQEEDQVGRPLGEAAHEVAVPLVAEGNVDPQLLALADQPDLLLVADAVEHLQFVLVRALARGRARSRAAAIIFGSWEATIG